MVKVVKVRIELYVLRTWYGSKKISFKLISTMEIDVNLRIKSLLGNFFPMYTA